MDKAVLQVRDMFVMSTKSVDQVARAGVFQIYFNLMIGKQNLLNQTVLNQLQVLNVLLREQALFNIREQKTGLQLGHTKHIRYNL